MTAYDIDPLATEAIEVNAAANGVTVRPSAPMCWTATTSRRPAPAWCWSPTPSTSATWRPG